MPIENVPIAGITGGPTTTPQQVSPPDKSKTQQQQFNKIQPVFRPIFYNAIKPGSIITFQYTAWKHDPYPLVLSTGIRLNGKMAGINLHYLTYNYIINLINQFNGKPFNYNQIKGNKFISKAFRTYKQQGVQNVKTLDGKFLLQTLGQIRSFNPVEIEAMRQHVRQQMNKHLGQTTADSLVNTEVGVVNNQ